MFFPLLCMEGGIESLITPLDGSETLRALGSIPSTARILKKTQTQLAHITWAPTHNAFFRVFFYNTGFLPALGNVEMRSSI